MKSMKMMAAVLLVMAMAALYVSAFAAKDAVISDAEIVEITAQMTPAPSVSPFCTPAPTAIPTPAPAITPSPSM